MLDNSNELARLINDAGRSATTKVNDTLRNLQDNTREAIEQSQRVATESMSQILKTRPSCATSPRHCSSACEKPTCCCTKC